MNELADFFPQLFAFAALLLVGLAASPFAARYGVPLPAAFLAVGIVAGLLDLAPPDNLGVLGLQQVGAIALYAILFQGGLDTGFRAWRRSAKPIVLLGLPGTAATAAMLAVAGNLVLGLDWPLAVLVGVALAPTDPAAVYSVLRRRPEQTRARTVLEGESGFNDPIGIALMVVAVEYLAEDATAADAVIRLVQELGIGLALGVLGGFAIIAALRATPRLDQGLQSLAVLVGALAVGAGTASLHGSGFLAVYIAGLLAADTWNAQDGPVHEAPAGAAAIAEPVIFGLLGAAFADTVGWLEFGQGVVLTVATAFLVRPLVAAACTYGSGLTRPERVLVSWGGLKGAVPLLLAGFPALEALDEADSTAAIVLVATAASIVVQGATLSRVAARTVANDEPAGPALAETAPARPGEP